VILILSTYFVKKFLEKVNEKDPGFVVIDEFLGVFFGFLFFFSVKTVVSYTLFFLFFRVFDILKPFPVGFLDGLSKRGGFWWQAFFIIADDLAAGVMASGMLKLIELTGFLP